MAKRDNGTRRTSPGTRPANARVAATADVMEERVVAFAEQLGRLAGTVQAKAEGWMDRDTLNKQIASVRDGAADLLEQLAGAATRASKTTKKPGSRPAPARAVVKPRSGGMVDARGKKHRRPLPSDPGAKIAESQAAKMRTAKSMVKTNKLRGRG